MTTIKIKSLAPIFFLIALVVISLIPTVTRVHAGTPLTFISDNIVQCSGTCAVTIPSIQSGDLIIAQMNLPNCAGGVFAGFSSSPSETYSQIQGIGSYAVISGTAHSTSSYTFTCASGTQGSFIVSIFRGTFNGFGSSILDFCSNPIPCGPGTITDTITFGVQAGSILYEGMVAYNNNVAPSNCPSITTLSGQTFIASACSQQTANSWQGQAFRSGPTPGAGTTNLGLSYSGCTGGSSTFCQTVDHSVLELTSIPANPSVGTTTVCYGVCGNPVPTLINPNATHPINFNVSQTIFYEAQSQLNGFIQNVTTNLAKSYSNGIAVSLGIYVIQFCPLNNAPFTPQCPGVLQTSVTFTNPSKGRLSIPLQTPISIGSWLGIAVASTVSGLDLNETNGTCGSTGGTNCASPPGLVTTSGVMPSAINAENLLNIPSISTTGLWAFITGNINPNTPTPLPTVSSCINSDLVCFEVASICGLSPSNCMIGGLVYTFAYFTILSIVVNLGLWWLKRETDIEGHIHPAFYPMLLLLLTYFMWGIGVFPISIIILETMIVVILMVGVVRHQTGVGED